MNARKSSFLLTPLYSPRPPLQEECSSTSSDVLAHLAGEVPGVEEGENRAAILRGLRLPGQRLASSHWSYSPFLFFGPQWITRRPNYRNPTCTRRSGSERFDIAGFLPKRSALCADFPCMDRTSFHFVAWACAPRVRIITVAALMLMGDDALSGLFIHPRIASAFDFRRFVVLLLTGISRFCAALSAPMRLPVGGIDFFPDDRCVTRKQGDFGNSTAVSRHGSPSESPTSPSCS